MPPAIPIATYRLQLTPRFGFDQAAAIVPYLKALGITHLYASPFLKARSGSTHGYDIIDHNAFNPELGGEDGFRALSRALAQGRYRADSRFRPQPHGRALRRQCLVARHAGMGPEVAPRRVLRHRVGHAAASGRAAACCCRFSARPYGEALESGEIELRYDAREGSFSAWYFDHRLPIGPSRYGEILSKVVAQAGAANEPAGRRLLELAARYQGPAQSPARTGSAVQAGDRRGRGRQRDHCARA